MKYVPRNKTLGLQSLQPAAPLHEAVMDGHIVRRWTRGAARDVERDGSRACRALCFLGSVASLLVRSLLGNGRPVLSPLLLARDVSLSLASGGT